METHHENSAVIYGGYSWIIQDGIDHECGLSLLATRITLHIFRRLDDALMEYFSKFLRASIPHQPQASHDHLQEFHRSWQLIKSTLQYPDERQLARGIVSTDVPAHLKLLVDALVWESTRTEEGTTGQCLEYLLKNDVLGNLVRLSETNRPFGIQAEVLRAVANMVVLLDEQFLVHSAVHKAVLRLLKGCVGDQLEEQVDGQAKVMGAASNRSHNTSSEYEADLVDLLCILCSRIRNYRELLMIFFHDKHWSGNHLYNIQELDEEAEDEDCGRSDHPGSHRIPSPTSSQTTITSAPDSSTHKKVEYEFLLFNYLLRFVHREGRIGDFARAGLLFLMDVAMSAGDPAQSSFNDNDGSRGPADLDATNSDPVADAALALAEYVLDGDFSDVLGAGLGAVYSLLPSKLDVRPDFISDSNTMQGGNNRMTLGTPILDTEEKQRLEFERERNRALGLESSSSNEFKSRLDHFLKLLEFLQDVLRHNTTTESQRQLVPSALVGNAIVQSILGSFRTVFLENILYTSILECSDADGSAVAVMSYIDIMVRTLGDSQLASVLVDFLISEDDHDAHRHQPRMLALDNESQKRRMLNKANRIRRRKSSAMALLEMEAPDSRKQTDYFTSLGRFTLKDLIFSNLRSPYQPSATAALQLLQSLLTYHSELCIDKLLVIVRDPDATSFPQLLVSKTETPCPSSPHSDDDDVFVYAGEEFEWPPSEAPTIIKQPNTTFIMHEREMDMYLTLVSRVASSKDHSSFSTGYSHYLNDAIMMIQSQSTFRKTAFDEYPTSTRSFHHRLESNDPLLRIILESLRAFFSHNPEYNIALTGVLAALALEPYRSLAGWLTFDMPKCRATFDQFSSFADADDGDDHSIDSSTGDSRSLREQHDIFAMSLDENRRPVLYSVLYELVSQLDRYRAQVENFDKYLLERRQGLLFSENLNDALTLALEVANDKLTPSRSSPAPPSPAKPKIKASSLVSFLTPKKKITLIGDSSEPRTPPRSNVISTSPFGSHYQETGAIAIQPLLAPLPVSGPWSLAKRLPLAIAEEDAFKTNAQWSHETPDGSLGSEGNSLATVTTVTLSHLLDNVVILEESIKELIATIHARRSLGIDAIRYE